MLYEEILEDAQEIKKRLMALGQNVDENTICELLESSGPNYKLEHIINMLTDNWNLDGQNNTGEISIVDITSNVEPELLRNFDNRAIRYEGTQEEYNEASDASSDYDDRDDYYASMNLDDISVVDTVTRSIPSPLEPCNRALPSSNSEATGFPPEVEFLEENNNDPNNNLGSVLMLPEYENNSSDIDRERRDSNMESRTEFIEKPESPKPGCSKDFHDTFVPHRYSHKLHTEASQINDLLPKLKQDIIYKTLWHNCNAKNRIELTLWDLLPERRPKPQIPSKRKLLDDMCSVEHKKNIVDTSEGNSKATCNQLEEVHSAHKKCPDGQSHVKKHTTDTIVDTNIEKDTTSDTNQQSTVSIRKTNLSEMDKSNEDVNVSNRFDKEEPVSSKICTKDKKIQLTEENPAILQETETIEVAHQNNSKSILRAPKLSFVSNNVICESPPPLPQKLPLSLMNAILSPPKFKVPEIPKQTSEKFRVVQCPRLSILKQSTALKQGTVLKQSTRERASSSTSANEKSDPSLQASTSKFGRCGVLEEKFRAATSLARKLSEVRECHLEVWNSKSSEKKTSPNLQPNNLGKTPTLSTAKNVSNNKSEIKNLLHEDNDINELQVMPLTSEEANTNTTKRLDVPNFMQPSSSKEIQATVIRHTVNYPKGYKNIEIHENTSTSVDNTQPKIGYLEVQQKHIENNMTDTNRALNQKLLKIYYKLIPMFPCVDTKYMKELCQNYINESMLTTDEIVILQVLVEHLLNHSEEHPNVQKPEPLPVQDTFDVNEQYANLLEIFPKADPIYLRNIAEQMYDKPDEIKQFVQSKLENPDYPTREQYLTKKKITEQQKQYTTDFQVAQFLQIFPDPFAYFEDDKRMCIFDIHAVDFLKHHFNKIRVNTLLNIYAQHNNNLSLTAKALETLNPDMKTKRNHALMQTENIPLLQECAYIQHKSELKLYLDELKEKEEKEFKKLKAKNELFECQCCYDNECMPSKCSTCDDGHIFCNTCIATCTDVKLAEGETHIHCLIDCGSEFHLSVLQHILLPTKFSILLQKRQEAEVMAAGLEGLVSCPFCHFASIPPPEDKVFKCLNPDCMKESCRSCKEINHLPLKCNETKSDAARLYLEEKMTEALIRKCYRCTRTFFKEEGCNKMTCVCGAQMCYICDKPISNYGHFRGQGSMAPDLCPLWSDDRRMNAEAVIHVCKETMKQIQEKNPDVQINTDALMPKLPPKTSGPHDDVAHANVLPAHANRVARHIP